MSSISQFRLFVERAGSRRQAAASIGCSLALIDHILSGRRSITKRVAESVERVTGGEIRKETLLWGDKAA